MSKRISTKSRGAMQHQAPIPAANSDGTFLGEALNDGNGVILGMGSGKEPATDERETVALLHDAAGRGDLAAIAELGTRYQLGVGVERRVCNAAEFHVIAALEGDRESAARLGSYREELEQEALNGRMLASLCLAKMHDRGIAVQEDKAKMLAWLLWGDERGNRNEDPDVYEELDDMRGFYGMTLSDDIKDVAWALLNQMRAATPDADGTTAKKRRKPSAKRKSSAKPVAGGG